MPFIQNRGDRNSRLWILLEKPYSSDFPKSQLLSGGMGFVLQKMLQEAGLNINDCYCASRRPDSDNENAFAILENDLNTWKPPLVLTLGEAGAYFLPELKLQNEASDGQLQKYAGSLLQSSMLSYPHYMVPLYDPQYCIANWDDRNVTVYVDLQKVRDELAHWRKHGVLQPLPVRTLKYHDMDADELFSYLDDFMHHTHISNDIENPIYKTTEYKPHPGYSILWGLASSKNFGISFKLFRDTPSENRELWRRLAKLASKVIFVGQNFFNYDALFENSLGFDIDLSRVQDTLIRHHILWPELSHKLQFLTRQYTREPYYKDEGHGWNIKQMDKYRRYNCLDACVTYEVYEAQEEEFAARPHLK